MLSSSEKHILHDHGQLGGVCVYCHTGIRSHIKLKHGLHVMRPASAGSVLTVNDGGGAADVTLASDAFTGDDDLATVEGADIKNTTLQKG